MYILKNIAQLLDEKET